MLPLPRFATTLVLGLLCLGALALGGAPSPSHAQPQRLSDRATVSMITILPGDRVYTEFGHSAFRVHDPAADIDWLFSYGTFDFDDPLFVPKFTYGRLTYFLSIGDYHGMIGVYRRQGRPVIEQVLNLTSEQQNRLYRFLQTNYQPENRYYQYDFLRDNCSTRIRDALESALGEAVQFTARPDPQRSFRRMLDPYVDDRPLLDVGFDLGLGTPADEVVSPRESMFLPEYLMAGFAHATIAAPDSVRAATGDPAGGSVSAAAPQPLVARTDTVVWVDGYDATERVFDWPLALAWLGLLGGLGWTGLQAVRGRAPGRRGDALLLAVCGGAGLVLCFLWFVSEHAVTGPNWNLAWTLPTHLVAAVALWRGGASSRLRAYLGATAAVALLLALGWGLVPQDLHASTLPLLLLLALRTGWTAYALAPRPRTADVVAG